MAKTFEEILYYRRSVRNYNPDIELDTERVKECIRLATFAPTSSNMQLWEFYHITSPDVMKKLSDACLNQQATRTAKQLVVFVTRQDLHRKRANDVIAFERENIRRNSPPEKQAKRIKLREMYYQKIMPFLYSRFFGVWGLLRKALVSVVGLFRPMVRQVSENDMRVVVHKTCGLAAQTFMLAMANEGYDTCPIEGFDSRRVKKILRLPRGAEINMVISCGVRLPDGVHGERFRVPFEDVYRKV